MRALYHVASGATNCTVPSRKALSMCVLLIAWKLRAETPLVVAANRDESRQRHSLAPNVLQLGDRRVLMPRDQLAGGTWLGVNDAGVAVAITNRRDGSFVPDRASRGQLPLAALQLSSAQAARSMVEARTAQEPFNAFNLFCADAKQAWVASWNGSLRMTVLQPGAYVLTNSHDLDELRVPEFRALTTSAASLPQLRTALRELLGDHQGRDAAGYPLCKHGSTYGTVSAAIFCATGATGWQMDFSPGNPCTTPFLQYTLHGDNDPAGG
jgi:uncharacterized protein with NRDE domain